MSDTTGTSVDTSGTRIYQRPLTIKANQDKAIAMMLAGKSDGDIAETLGCSRRAVSAWRTRNLNTIQPRSEAVAAHLDTLAIATREARMQDYAELRELWWEQLREEGVQVHTSRELRAVDEQAAVEAGHRRSDVNINQSTTYIRVFKGLEDEELLPD